MWKNGIGELEPSAGASLGISSSTLLTDHSPDSFTAGANPKSVPLLASDSRGVEKRCHGKAVLATTSRVFAPFVISSCAPMVFIRDAIWLGGDVYRLLSAIFVAGFSVAGQGELRKRWDDDGEKK